MVYKTCTRMNLPQPTWAATPCSGRSSSCTQTRSPCISVPPKHVHDRLIDGVLHPIPNKAEVRPQLEALVMVWRGITTSIASHRFCHCDILPLPPWITHHRNAFVYGHALGGDTSICFSISGYG
ncbi:hypothetical protein ZWY2020_059988 [Hordeum vulgare]|nr:hypothetical protein ZWY2020_059988 [Hordeum vulgare]